MSLLTKRHLCAVALAAVAFLPPTLAAAVTPCTGKTILRGARTPIAATIPTNDAGCISGHRIGVRQGLAFWRCQVTPEGEGAILVERLGAMSSHLADQIGVSEVAAWHVVGADLDGSGNRSWVVATWNGQTQGLGVNYWTLFIFRPDGTYLNTTTEVADWSPTLVVKASGSQRGCAIGIPTLIQSRQGASIWQVHFNRLRQRTLSPDRGLGTFERRLDARFLAERATWNARPGFNPEGNPTAWLARARKVQSRR